MPALIKLLNKIPIIDIDILTPGFVEKSSSKSPSRETLSLEWPEWKHDKDIFKAQSERQTDLIKLREVFKQELHPARTLDEYAFDASLEHQELHHYNSNQVFSRWLHWDHSKKESISFSSCKPEAQGDTFASIWGRLLKWIPELIHKLSCNAFPSEASDVEMQPSTESQSKDATPATNDNKHRVQFVLVVSQLWIFRPSLPAGG